jgi:hypothetical protein
MEICEIQSHLLVHNITTEEDWVLQRLLTLDKAMMQFPKFQGSYMMDRLPMRRLMNEIKCMLSHKGHAIKIVISTSFKFFSYVMVISIV